MGGRSRRSSTSSDSDYGAPIRITGTQVLPPTRSQSGRHRHHSPDTVVVNANSYLQLPGQVRIARASSASGQPVPVINNFYADDRSRSHSRHRDCSSSSSDYRRCRSRRRHSHLPSDVIVDLTLADRERDERSRERAIKRAVRDAKQKEQDEKEEHKSIVLQAKLKEEADKRKAEEKEKQIVEAWKQREWKKKEKAEKEEKRFDEMYERRVMLEFLAAGYSEATIESIIKKSKDKERDNRLAIGHARPTFIRVHTSYLSTATLEHFGLPWQYDRDANYIIIKKHISHDFQKDLFDHTKSLKNRKLLKVPKLRRHLGVGETILSTDRSNLFVVKKKTRSKSPARTYYIRTK